MRSPTLAEQTIPGPESTSTFDKASSYRADSLRQLRERVRPQPGLHRGFIKAGDDVLELTGVEMGHAVVRGNSYPILPVGALTKRTSFMSDGRKFTGIGPNIALKSQN